MFFSSTWECCLGYYDISHVLWTPHGSESALVMGDRINGVSSRTYNLQRPIGEGRNCQKMLNTKGRHKRGKSDLKEEKVKSRGKVAHEGARI